MTDPAARVLFVVTLASRSGAYGGPSEVAAAQAEMIGSTGGHVELLAGTLPGDEPLTRTPWSTYVPVRRLIPSPGFTGVLSAAYARTAWRLLRWADTTVISISREAIPCLTLAMAVGLRRRVLLQPHGMLTSRTSLWHRVFDLVLKPLARRADGLIALTDTEADELRTWLGRRAPVIHVIGNPVESAVAAIPRPREPVEASGPVVLFCARLHPRKRVVDFVDGAAVFDRNRWRGQFVVLGPDGGDVELVRLAARRLPNLTYAGAVPPEEVSGRLQDCDVFVLPSAREPWGTVLASALALGRPVVLTASSALAGLVRAYSAGVVVPDGDPEALADAVHRLLEDADERARLGRAGQRLAQERLSNERVLIDLTRALEQVDSR